MNKAIINKSIIDYFHGIIKDLFPHIKIYRDNRDRYDNYLHLSSDLHHSGSYILICHDHITLDLFSRMDDNIRIYLTKDVSLSDPDCFNLILNEIKLAFQEERC